MASNFNATLSIRLTGLYSASSDLTTRADAFDYLKENTYSYGTGANACNLFYADTRTLVAGSETLDLNDTVVDAFGSTCIFTKVKLLLLRNQSTTAGELIVVSGDFLYYDTTSPLGGTTPYLRLQPGETRVMQSPIVGFPVNASSDNIVLNPGTNTITYDIIIAGSTA